MTTKTNTRPDPDASFRFGTKAVTLDRLASLISLSKVCDRCIFPFRDWLDNRETITGEIVDRFGGMLLAVRSSAHSEDEWDNSAAGINLSHINIDPERMTVEKAVDDVFSSYKNATPDCQVLVQPMVQGVEISGVVLTRELDTGSPYYVVNYDDFSGRTDTVTGGAISKTILVHRSRPDALKSIRFRKLIDSIIEIESITGSNELDVEFCITGDDVVFILQVRPLAARKKWKRISDESINAVMGSIKSFIEDNSGPKPGVAGAKSVLGYMPDWNPAEMIGTTPRPMALSLYKHLITDRVWAEARSKMGYRMVDAPLMVDLGGRPYIDVKMSLNSFLPAGLDDRPAGMLVDHQINFLAENQELHDKIEFEVAVTCLDLDFESKKKRIRDAGLSEEELDSFVSLLTDLTRNALLSVKGGIDELVAATDSLIKKSKDAKDAPLMDRVHGLLDDCVHFGTLPFSILARHGFIAVQFLQSLVTRGVFTQEDADRFMRGISTVATHLVHDMWSVSVGDLEKEKFLSRYGHLRPGTYDIMSNRYDEQPDLFLGQAQHKPAAKPELFKPSARQNREIGNLLKESGFDIPVAAFLEYIVKAVQAREQAKFSFTRNISDALSLLGAWGESKGLSRRDISFLTIQDTLSDRPVDDLKGIIENNESSYDLARAIRLPHLIVSPTDVDVVRIPLGQPTFITDQSITAQTVRIDSRNIVDIGGGIVLIENADPGFDWIFSHDIAGLITKYGGANSHMAIRCAEFGLPAAIGCGERLFESLLKASVIELNCGARKIDGH